VTEGRIAYEGSLDIASVSTFTDQVRSAAQENERVVVDFQRLEFVDSTGVRGLVMLKQQLANEGKQLVFEGFGPHIMDIFDILGIREMIVEA